MTQHPRDLNISISRHYRNSSMPETKPRSQVWRPTAKGRNGNVLKMWQSKAGALADRVLSKKVDA